MKRAGRFVAGAALCALLSASAVADPFEDGSKAFERGDFATARDVLSQSAAQGDSRAQALLGLIYTFGLGVPADAGLALQWFNLSADAGDPRGQTGLGDVYYEGLGVPVDYAQALKYYERAAKQNWVHAQYRLGEMYERGAGVAKDMRQALGWYQTAARGGDPDAEYRIAYYDFYGEGGSKNFEEAARLLKSAAEKNNVRAISLLGYAYDNGYGVPQDYAEAVKYYSRAAARGEPAALGLLGEKYQSGKGVTQDWGRAYMLLSLAASKLQGSVQQTLIKERDDAATHLDGPALAKAQADAKDCADSNFKRCGIDAGAEKDASGAAHNDAHGVPVPVARADLGRRDAKGMEMVASGTAFYVSAKGELITNAHVTEECGEVRSFNTVFKIVAQDRERDLALLQAPKPVKEFARIRGGKGGRLGEAVVVVGFPVYGLLGNDPVVTTGLLAGTAGLLNDNRRIEISAPVQPGNSGGPVLGEDGAVVGVANMQFQGKEADALIGRLPQNMNFAINVATLTGFLESHKVRFVLSDSGLHKSTADISADASRYTIVLECWK